MPARRGRLDPADRRRRRSAACARAAVNSPVSSREPAQATPNRAPSSSTKLTTPIGRAGVKPSARSASIAASADTTPSGPSNAPPSGTESRWLPATMPGAAIRDRPTRPTGCRCGRPRPSSPRCSAAPANHSRRVRSASVQAKRAITARRRPADVDDVVPERIEAHPGVAVVTRPARRPSESSRPAAIARSPSSGRSAQLGRQRIGGGA